MYSGEAKVRKCSLLNILVYDTGDFNFTVRGLYHTIPMEQKQGLTSRSMYIPISVPEDLRPKGLKNNAIPYQMFFVDIPREHLQTVQKAMSGAGLQKYHLKPC